MNCPEKKPKTNNKKIPPKAKATVPFESQNMSVQFWINFSRMRSVATYRAVNVDL